MLNHGTLKKVKGRKRFRTDFGSEEEAFNDNFRIGIAIDKQMRPRLFESMFESDIIVASPIGLRILTGLQKSEDKDEEEETMTQGGKKNFDFLSSIEFLVVDSAEAFVFQNLQHLEEVIKILNKRPKKLAGLNDISRLKNMYTDDRMGYLPKYFRQNIVVQKFQNQEMNFIFDTNFNTNVFGKI